VLQLALLVMAAVRVEGSTTCPSPSAVTAGVSALDSAATTGSFTVRLAGSDDRLHIELFDDSNRRIAQRTLEQAGSCLERARVVAAVISLWQGQFSVESAFDPPPPESPQPSASTSRSAQRPSEAGAPSVRMGAGGAALLTSSEAAFEATLFADLLFSHSPFGLELSLFGQTPFTVTFDPGSASWSRWGAGVGALVAWRLGPTEIELHADLLLAFLIAQGSGLASNMTASQVDPGFQTGFRILVPAGNWSPWLGSFASFWPRPETIYVTDPSQSSRVSQLMVSAGAGVTLALF
jgi:hypothetical protein